MKFFLSVVFFGFSISIVAQKTDSSSIYSYYDGASLKLPMHGLTINLKTQYEKTDTVKGYEIDYSYFENGQMDKCRDLNLFTLDSSIIKLNNILDFLKHSKVYNLNSGAERNPSNDTFYYYNNENLYFETNFYKFSENGKEQKEFYKISNSEYIKVASVRAVMDFFLGADSLRQYFFPFESTNDKGTMKLIQMQYRKVLSKKYLYPEKLFGIRKGYYDQINECVYRPD